MKAPFKTGDLIKWDHGEYGIVLKIDPSPCGSCEDLFSMRVCWETGDVHWMAWSWRSHEDQNLKFVARANK